jgi:hypothetical protein
MADALTNHTEGQGQAKRVKRHTHIPIRRPPSRTSPLLTLLAVIFGVVLVFGAIAGAEWLHKRSAKGLLVDPPAAKEPASAPVEKARPPATAGPAEAPAPTGDGKR